VPHAAAVTPVVTLRAQVISQYSNWQTTVSGASPAWPYVRSWYLQSGSFFSDADVATSAKVAVIGTTVASELFPGQDSVIGQTIRINNVPFRVIGLLVSRGHNAFGGDQDDTVVIPYSALLQRLSTSANGPNVVGALMISIDDPKNIASTITAVSELLRTRHRIVPPQTDDFQVRDLADIAQVANSTGVMLQVLLASVAAVSLVVGGIGIMNIMLVSVTERTREIGLRMAVGARNAAILLQFLVEAAVLSMLGGAAGVLLGVGFSRDRGRPGPLSVHGLVPHDRALSRVLRRDRNRVRVLSGAQSVSARSHRRSARRIALMARRTRPGRACPRSDLRPTERRAARQRAASCSAFGFRAAARGQRWRPSRTFACGTTRP